MRVDIAAALAATVVVVGASALGAVIVFGSVWIFETYGGKGLLYAAALCWIGWMWLALYSYYRKRNDGTLSK